MLRCAAAWLLLCGPALAVGEATQDPPPPPGQAQPQDAITDLDLEDLLNVRVTSLAKREQSLSHVPAAVHVIRGEDLRRVGVTSIPEALRAVPGLQVARAQAGTWAISARGFNDTSSNKLLVLMDGRSMYSPLHSGVFWDVQDTFLDDIDRIEVVRGPGGSLWGANAVNGVVNVITKPSGETLEGRVYAGAGTEERGFGGGRYGFAAKEDLTLRVYAKHFDRDDARLGSDPGEDAHDDWSMSRGGLRGDWTLGPGDRITFTGDYYDGEAQRTATVTNLTSPAGFDRFNERTDLRGGHFLARWEREIDASSNLVLQAYYDHTFRAFSLFTDTLHTADLDFQHRFTPGGSHDVTWGLGWRIYWVRLDGTFVFDTEPGSRTDQLFSAFVQDETDLVPGRLRLTVGAKFEHNDYSGFEVQPSARLAWTPHEKQFVWASVSRAVRTPTIIDHDGRLNIAVIPLSPPLVGSLFGNEDFESEKLIAYEAGYRAQPLSWLSLDLALFYNRYDDLRSLDIGDIFTEDDPPPSHQVLPVPLANNIKGRTWGAEPAVNVQAAAWWLIQGNYAFLRMNLDPGSGEGSSPRRAAWLRSAMDLPHNLTLDVVGRYVGRLTEFDIDAYTEVDVRVAWRHESKKLEVAIVGQNLLKESHPEFQTEAQRSEVERGGYMSVRWDF